MTLMNIRAEANMAAVLCLSRRCLGRGGVKQVYTTPLAWLLCYPTLRADRPSARHTMNGHKPTI